ncbi:hypothetical protein RCL1_001394 [Eukaryota sp. TZLM3-RCL]
MILTLIVSLALLTVLLWPRSSKAIEVIDFAFATDVLLSSSQVLSGNYIPFCGKKQLRVSSIPFSCKITAPPRPDSSSGLTWFSTEKGFPIGCHTHKIKGQSPAPCSPLNVFVDDFDLHDTIVLKPPSPL